jgi:hypothetical protein
MRVLSAPVGPARSRPSWQRPSPTYDHPAGAHFSGGADHVVFVRSDNMARRIDHSPLTRHRQRIIIVVNLSRCATGYRAIRALLSLRMATLPI